MWKGRRSLIVCVFHHKNKQVKATTTLTMNMNNIPMPVIPPHFFSSSAASIANNKLCSTHVDYHGDLPDGLVSQVMNAEYANGADPIPLAGRSIQLNGRFPSSVPPTRTMDYVVDRCRCDLGFVDHFDHIPIQRYLDKPPQDLINIARCWIRIQNIITRFDLAAHQGLAQGGEAFRPQIASAAKVMAFILNTLIGEMYKMMSVFVDGCRDVASRWMSYLADDVSLYIVSYRYDNTQSFDIDFMERGCVFRRGVDANEFNPFSSHELLSFEIKY
ncbi:MAG TPA: hypothetical protein V6C97_21595 [Oculatellaceae cyanobacterium]